MRVSALIGQIGDNIGQHPKQELKVSKDMNEGHDDIDEYIETSNNKDQGRLKLLKYLLKGGKKAHLQIDPNHVINNESHKQEGIKGEDVAEIMGLLGPLVSMQTPHETQDYHEYVNHGHDLSTVLDHVVGAGLDDRRVEGEQVERRDQVAVQER